MKIKSLLASLIAVGIGPSALASSPFDGTWTVNVGKSHRNPETLSWEDAENGRLKFTNPNGSYTFEPDGQMFNTPFGDQQSFKEIGKGVYNIVTKQNGILRGTETIRLSPDGNSFSLEIKGTTLSGQTFDNHSTYTRMSPGSGLIGEWRSSTVAKASPNTLTIRTSGNSDVTLTLSALKATINGKWDGRPYPVQSPVAPKGATATLNRTGPAGFELDLDVGAMRVESDRFTLGSDDREMIEQGLNGKGLELFVNIWDKKQ